MRVVVGGEFLNHNQPTCNHTNGPKRSRGNVIAAPHTAVATEWLMSAAIALVRCGAGEAAQEHAGKVHSVALLRICQGWQVIWCRI